jgi:hypothetical protein
VLPYCTVTLTEVVCVIDPDVAVMVIIAGPAFCGGLYELPYPQPPSVSESAKMAKPAAVARTGTRTRVNRCPRRTIVMKANDRAANSPPSPKPTPAGSVNP